MKNSLRFLRLAVAGTLAAAFFLGGCASPEHGRTTGEYFGDQAVNARVKSALLQDDVVAGTDVSTTTFDGVVQLSGFVDDPEQRERAEEIAREIQGVETVVNNINVNPRATQFGSPGDVDDADADEPQAEPQLQDEPEAEVEPDSEAEAESQSERY